jgi:hypothetical protein
MVYRSRRMVDARKWLASKLAPRSMATRLRPSYPALVQAREDHCTRPQAAAQESRSKVFVRHAWTIL